MSRGYHDSPFSLPVPLSGSGPSPQGMLRHDFQLILLPGPQAAAPAGISPGSPGRTLCRFRNRQVPGLFPMVLIVFFVSHLPLFQVLFPVKRSRQRYSACSRRRAASIRRPGCGCDSIARTFFVIITQVSTNVNRKNCKLFYYIQICFPVHPLRPLHQSME